MRRLLVPRSQLGGGRVRLASADLHYVRDVLRLAPGAAIEIFDGEGAAYDHYDREWATQMPISKSGVHPERWRPQPPCYPEMLEAAEALSKPFPYVRMDFYAVGPKAVLGEMTFTPAGCIDTGYTDEAQRAMGDLIHPPEPL